jgi:hypothetical protein
MNPPPATTEGVGRKSSPTTVILHGRRLFFARAAWVALATLSFGLVAASLPAAYEQLSTVCEGWRGWCDYARLLPEEAGALERVGLSVGFYPAYKVAFSIVLVLGYWSIGAILFWKRPDNGAVLLASVMLVTFGTVQADTLQWLADAYPAWALPVRLMYFVAEASLTVFFCVFPDGRFVPRWTRWVAVASITYWLLDSFFPNSLVSPTNWPLVISAPLLLGLIVSLVVAQIYRYRRVSGPVERQHTKWVFFGFTATIVMFLVATQIGFALPKLGIPQVFYNLVSTPVFVLSTFLIPLSIGFAMLGFPALVIRTVVYSSLISVVGAVYTLTDLLLVPLLAQSTLGEKDRSLIAFFSVVIIVVLFKPLRSRIEAGVNRLGDWLGSGDEASSFISPPPHRDEPSPFIRPPSDR